MLGHKTTLPPSPLLTCFVFPKVGPEQLRVARIDLGAIASAEESLQDILARLSSDAAIGPLGIPLTSAAQCSLVLESQVRDPLPTPWTSARR